MSNVAQRRIASSLVIASIAVAACGGGEGGTIGIGVIGQREAPGNGTFESASPSGRSGSSGSSGSSGTSSSSGGSTSSSSGSSGGGSSFKCSGTYRCIDASGDSVSVTLAESGGTCAASVQGKNVVVEKDGSLTLDGQKYGTWTYASGKFQICATSNVKTVEAGDCGICTPQ